MSNRALRESDQLGDWLLLKQVEQLLEEYSSAGVESFQRTDGDGAVYFLGSEKQVDRPSITNTAALWSLHNEAPRLCQSVAALLPQWRRVLDPRLRESSERLDIKKPEKSELDAFRCSEVLLVIDDRDSRRRLRTWLDMYVSRWLHRKWNFQPNLHLVYLAVQAIEVLPKRLEQKVQRLAEFSVSQQVAHSDGQLEAEFDAVSLAFAMALGGAGVSSSRMAVTAFGLLNTRVDGPSTWKAQSLAARSRVPASSSFTALLALVRSPVLAGASNPLGPAIRSHWEWLRDQRSDHPPWRASDLYLREDIIEPWFNVLAIRFSLYLQEQARRVTQAELRRKYQVERTPTKLAWSKVLLPRAEKEALEKAFLKPIKDEGRLSTDYRTALLFGPPGTAKTTIVEVIAAEVGWPLIEIGVAEFLSQGLDSVFSQSVEIFRDLLRLENAVVLLDEVEGVFAARDEKERDLRQKFLTSALLPPLKRVHDRGRIALFIATNFIEEFDEAARRPGRIDLVVPVGPPNQNDRRELLEDVLNLNRAVAGELAGLLSDGTTIGEILEFARVVRGRRLRSAGGYYRVWKKRYPSPQITPADLEDHERLASAHRRLP